MITRFLRRNSCWVPEEGIIAGAFLVPLLRNFPSFPFWGCHYSSLLTLEHPAYIVVPKPFKKLCSGFSSSFYFFWKRKKQETETKEHKWCVFSVVLLLLHPPVLGCPTIQGIAATGLMDPNLPTTGTIQFKHTFLISTSDCAANMCQEYWEQPFFSPLMILIFFNYFFNFRKINKMLFGLLFSDWASGMTYTPPAEIHGFKNCLEHCAIAVLVTEVGLSFVLKKTVIAWFCLGKKLLCKRKKIGNFLFSVKALLHFAESLGLQREAAE